MQQHVGTVFMLLTMDYGSGVLMYKHKHYLQINILRRNTNYQLRWWWCFLILNVLKNPNGTLSFLFSRLYQPFSYHTYKFYDPFWYCQYYFVWGPLHYIRKNILKKGNYFSFISWFDFFLSLGHIALVPNSIWAMEII